MSIKKFTPPTNRNWGVAHAFCDAINIIHFYVFHRSIAFAMCPQKIVGG